MRKTLLKVLTANVVLWSLALAIGCSCLCGKGSRPTSVGSAPSRSPGQSGGRPGESWRFVVSGDSRNCGDVVMPAIAAGAKLDGAAFYWHLGDLRAIYDFDQDMVQAAKDHHLTISDYEKNAWPDFMANQVAPFQNIPMPFYLGIGNHETIPPKNRCEFVKTFAALMDKPEFQHEENNSTLMSQSKANAAKGSKGGAEENKESVQCGPVESKTYYHWTRAGVEFIYLDNASDETFDQPQLDWAKRVIDEAAVNQSITTVVVGMHKALPWSLTCDHSMNETKDGTRSGEIVYRQLLELQKKKKVYVVASHSHYFMSDIYNTKRWRSEGVLPGWIVGTGGAQRYPLPAGADLAKSKTYVYGYLLAKVYSDGTIDFSFTELKEGDIPIEVKNRYTEQWISQSCFDGNRKTSPSPEPEYCKETSAQP